MTSADFEQEPLPSAYGAQRRADWLAHHQANADMAERAAVEAHGQTEDHRVVQAGQQGMFPGMSPYDRGAAAAALPASVGGDWGQGRPLERNGHLAQSIGPAPARVYQSQINDRPGFMPGEEPGVSPLLAHMRGQR